MRPQSHVEKSSHTSFIYSNKAEVAAGRGASIDSLYHPRCHQIRKTTFWMRCHCEAAWKEVKRRSARKPKASALPCWAEPNEPGIFTFSGRADEPQRQSSAIGCGGKTTCCCSEWSDTAPPLSHSVGGTRGQPALMVAFVWRHLQWSVWVWGERNSPFARRGAFIYSFCWFSSASSVSWLIFQQSRFRKVTKNKKEPVPRKKKIPKKQNSSKMRWNDAECIGWNKRLYTVNFEKKKKNQDIVTVWCPGMWMMKCTFVTVRFVLIL